ncbi:MAG: 3-methyl-2-oxobutanoate hydroxymethyltransferase [Candidatus Omnitrophica bacterium]|nr:3-methyl-2-oxobutanoate hydroxymethyltransferase [Candidatus Omnitrophota bacterium]MBU1925234.1 3-methyl-2-oxobutanoate hydroxymethyltransferase [Candidatus Omnitrophota bacterium]MBU2063513.1 3-methyl-2-oxobutanoate hydroxymethyltransferase [Candidatus Omnitrophota bacterium]
MERKKITIPDLLKMKQQGIKITMLTAYDYPLASIIDAAGVDMILVGDSVGNVVLGYESTIPVTMDEMIHHTKAVRRGTKFAFLVGDMPFMSFNVSPEDTISNAGRFIKEAGADAVKLEGGGTDVIRMVKAVVGAGIPVMGHLGLTPQTATMLGGLKAQGKDEGAARKILEQALALEAAGCFSIVFECIPAKLAELISKKLKITAIGIGAGPACDGQVLVTHDMLGLYGRFVPKFVKQYVDLSGQISAGIIKYIEEVRGEQFPGVEHVFNMDEKKLKELKN